MNNIKDKKVALVYDRVNKWGGAERVLLALHELFPKAPLYTAIYNSEKAAWAKVFEIRTSFLQKIPFASAHHEYLPLLMPFAFENFSFDEYDIVISVTSESAKGIITKPGTLHICYCLTPTRYLWSGYDEYFQNQLFRILSKPATYYLRKWDRQAARRPDAYIAISKEVQKRIERYYGRKSEIVYPPVGLAIRNSQIFNGKSAKSEDFFLVVSRLVPYKRIDIAIQACNELRLPLKIIGTGSYERKLRNIAGPTIEFVSTLTDIELAQYYSSCRALLFPGHEDFGLSMVEAQSFGKPVIAYGAGGALEIIAENKTGIFFSPQHKDRLKEAINKFESLEFIEKACRSQADRFNLNEFNKQFLSTFDKLFTSLNRSSS